ncbi:hypothetical protein ACIRON_24560 [Nocardioides sp. NPDC101246]|uniref:hypothetical protein n=1 Tax=Nocardioides sp. NPDC101246 TaxID=3364336 RepID=UPI00381CFDC9
MSPAGGGSRSRYVSVPVMLSTVSGSSGVDGPSPMRVSSIRRRRETGSAVIEEPIASARNVALRRAKTLGGSMTVSERNRSGERTAV